MHVNFGPVFVHHGVYLSSIYCMDILDYNPHKIKGRLAHLFGTRFVQQQLALRDLPA
jgi:hypothetical protein